MKIKDSLFILLLLLLNFSCSKEDTSPDPAAQIANKWWCAKAGTGTISSQYFKADGIWEQGSKGGRFNDTGKGRRIIHQGSDNATLDIAARVAELWSDIKGHADKTIGGIDDKHGLVEQQAGPCLHPVESFNQLFIRHRHLALPCYRKLTWVRP